MVNCDRRVIEAQQSIIGSMLIDDRCVPLVISKMAEEDFIDPTCRKFFQAIRALALEGRPVDPVTVNGRLNAGNDYVRWAREVMEVTPTAANVESYIPDVCQAARRQQVLEIAEGLAAADYDGMGALVRKCPPPCPPPAVCPARLLMNVLKTSMRICKTRKNQNTCLGASPP